MGRACCLPDKLKEGLSAEMALSWFSLQPAVSISLLIRRFSVTCRTRPAMEITVNVSCPGEKFQVRQDGLHLMSRLSGWSTARRGRNNATLHAARLQSQAIGPLRSSNV
jgi:hypothetical protein